ncbi:Small heat shock protein RTM2-like protein [Aduncisulcus paluster]|uniref:Small heat shock protein RTM2-like protein n=1 Tax=Aduncisulcus paluster TaxID=2918883 RepID=A0ABQ5JY61_9EUKA|nr:Small heat shock protein RTM2-like protein [Aduncisulcus paluster]
MKLLFWVTIWAFISLLWYIVFQSLKYSSRNYGPKLDRWLRKRHFILTPTSFLWNIPIQKSIKPLKKSFSREDIDNKKKYSFSKVFFMSIVFISFPLLTFLLLTFLLQLIRMVVTETSEVSMIQSFSSSAKNTLQLSFLDEEPSSFAMFGLIIGSVLISVFIHELGHVIVGLTQGMYLCSINIGISLLLPSFAVELTDLFLCEQHFTNTQLSNSQPQNPSTLSSTIPDKLTSDSSRPSIPTQSNVQSDSGGTQSSESFDRGDSSSLPSQNEQKTNSSIPSPPKRRENGISLLLPSFAVELTDLFLCEQHFTNTQLSNSQPQNPSTLSSTIPDKLTSDSSRPSIPTQSNVQSDSGGTQSSESFDRGDSSSLPSQNEQKTNSSIPSPLGEHGHFDATIFQQSQPSQPQLEPTDMTQPQPSPQVHYVRLHTSSPLNRATVASGGAFFSLMLGIALLFLSIFAFSSHHPAIPSNIHHQTLDNTCLVTSVSSLPLVDIIGSDNTLVPHVSSLMYDGTYRDMCSGEWRVWEKRLSQEQREEQRRKSTSEKEGNDLDDNDSTDGDFIETDSSQFDGKEFEEQGYVFTSTLNFDDFDDFEDNFEEKRVGDAGRLWAMGESINDNSNFDNMLPNMNDSSRRASVLASNGLIDDIDVVFPSTPCLLPHDMILSVINPLASERDEFPLLIPSTSINIDSFLSPHQRFSTSYVSENTDIREEIVINDGIYYTRSLAGDGEPEWKVSLKSPNGARISREMKRGVCVRGGNVMDEEAMNNEFRDILLPSFSSPLRERVILYETNAVNTPSKPSQLTSDNSYGKGEYIIPNAQSTSDSIFYSNPYLLPPLATCPISPLSLGSLVCITDSDCELGSVCALPKDPSSVYVAMIVVRGEREKQWWQREEKRIEDEYYAQTTVENEGIEFVISKPAAIVRVVIAELNYNIKMDQKMNFDSNTSYRSSDAISFDSEDIRNYSFSSALYSPFGDDISSSPHLSQWWRQERARKVCLFISGITILIGVTSISLWPSMDYKQLIDGYNHSGKKCGKMPKHYSIQPDDRTTQGRDLILERLLAHRIALLKAKPAVATDQPMSHVDKRMNKHRRAKKLQASHSIEHQSMLGKMKKTLSKTRPRIETGPPPSLSHSTRKKGRIKSKGDSFLELEHKKMLKKMKTALDSTHTLAQRRKNQYDTSCYPSLLIRHERAGILDASKYVPDVHNDLGDLDVSNITLYSLTHSPQKKVSSRYLQSSLQRSYNGQQRSSSSLGSRTRKKTTSPSSQRQRSRSQCSVYRTPSASKRSTPIKSSQKSSQSKKSIGFRSKKVKPISSSESKQSIVVKKRDQSRSLHSSSKSSPHSQQVEESTPIIDSISSVSLSVGETALQDEQQPKHVLLPLPKSLASLETHVLDYIVAERIVKAERIEYVLDTVEKESNSSKTWDILEVGRILSAIALKMRILWTIKTVERKSIREEEEEERKRKEEEEEQRKRKEEEEEQRKRKEEEQRKRKEEEEEQRKRKEEEEEEQRKRKEEEEEEERKRKEEEEEEQRKRKEEEEEKQRKEEEEERKKKEEEEEKQRKEEEEKQRKEEEQRKKKEEEEEEEDSFGFESNKEESFSQKSIYESINNDSSMEEEEQRKRKEEEEEEERKRKEEEEEEQRKRKEEEEDKQRKEEQRKRKEEEEEKQRKEEEEQRKRKEEEEEKQRKEEEERKRKKEEESKQNSEKEDSESSDFMDDFSMDESSK